MPTEAPESGDGIRRCNCVLQTDAIKARLAAAKSEISHQKDLLAEEETIFDREYEKWQTERLTLIERIDKLKAQYDLAK